MFRLVLAILSCTLAGWTPAPVEANPFLDPNSPIEVPEGMNPIAYEKAILSFRKKSKRISRKDFLAIVDFTQPSSSKRLYVIDLNNDSFARFLVQHGEGSGQGEYATQFSNIPDSNMSSLGAYVTGMRKPKCSAETQTACSEFKDAMYLFGMEPTNSNAAGRSIIFHSSADATESWIRDMGQLGLSKGCPAVDPDVAPVLVEKLVGGAFFYIYGESR